ncbi:hypothetical protein [Lachnospira sp.]|jgi:membrane-associated HD superfamily phosphohydrolase|uniref:hypothetical protein n=1 Tax=Lachnospira sp. TaxID=2049031 RepID=UPI00257EAC8C|nr:hypothetical protein [Lachnospira sp.]
MSEIFTLVWLVFVVVCSAIIGQSKKKNKNNSQNARVSQQARRQQTKVNKTNFTQWNSASMNNSASQNFNNFSSNGQKIDKSFDYTCETRYDHTHRPEYSMPNRYVVHEKPTTGYIVLNGKRYSKKELKNM